MIAKVRPILKEKAKEYLNMMKELSKSDSEKHIEVNSVIIILPKYYTSPNSIQWLGGQ